MIRIPRVLAAAAAVVWASASGQASAEDGWTWSVEPYVWVASVGTDLRTFRPPTESESELDFRDVIDKIEGVFQGRVEGRGDRFGAFADFIYLGLGDSAQRRVVSTETDLDARLLDAAVSWRPGGERNEGIDLYAGIRYVDVDLGVQFIPDDPAFAERSIDSGRSYTDLLAGARYTWQSDGNWGLTVGGDLSFGDTEGSWAASAATHYRTGNGMWILGYRYLEVELGDDEFDATITLSGPQIGYAFIF